MARDGAIGVAPPEGYFARRSPLELMVLDALIVAAVVAAAVPRAAALDPLGFALLLFFLPSSALAIRSMGAAMAAPGRRSVRELRPDHVPSPSRSLVRARALARRGVLLAAVPVALVGAVAGAASLVP